MRRLLDSDLAWRFGRSPLAIVALVVTLVMAAGALLAPAIAPQDPFDPASLDLMNSLIPPAFEAQGDPQFPLGTDDQGRDLFSAILYGTRISLMVGFAGVALAMLIGVTLGLVAGYRGGWVGAVIMRVADVQLTFPAILIALLINGVALAVVGKGGSADMQIGVIIVAIGLSYWVQYARTVRGSTLVERNKEYVQAARVIGVSGLRIMRRHVLPNVLGPVLVLATIQIASAIITEATLSFLGVGVPATSPSLGTLIRNGNDYLFSGEWWITAWPSLTLILITLSVNLLGDWLRDALNPRLR